MYMSSHGDDGCSTHWNPLTELEEHGVKGGEILPQLMCKSNIYP